MSYICYVNNDKQTHNDMNKNRRNRLNDNYEGKVTFWTDQLELALEGKSKYSVQKCDESLKYFKSKRAEALAKNA